MAGTLLIDETSIDADELLGELAMRLVEGERSTTDGYPRLYVATLPDETPANVLFPNGARIIGSAIRAPGNLRIFAQAETDPKHIIGFYESEAPNQGWEIASSYGGRHGFVRASMRDRTQARFTHRDLAFDLFVKSWASGEGKSEFVVRVNPADRSQLHPATQQSMRLSEETGSPLPTLYPPAGTWKSGGGGSGGGRHRDSSAVLETELSAEVLMKHFATQLEESNWTQLGTLDRGSTLVSYWEFEDRNGHPCLGFLSVTEDKEHSEIKHLRALSARFGVPSDPSFSFG